MKNIPLFISNSIRLTALDAEADSAIIAKWTQSGHYIHFLDNVPSHPLSMFETKKMLAGLIKESGEKQSSFWFGIRTLDESELLGIVGLNWVDWSNGGAFMKLVMKDLPEYTNPSTIEALGLMERYVFHELQMHHLSIAVPTYNEKLITVLKKLGFKDEVYRREAVYRFGRYWDDIIFGRLASNWQKGKSDGR